MGILTIRVHEAVPYLGLSFLNCMGSLKTYLSSVYIFRFQLFIYKNHVHTKRLWTPECCDNVHMVEFFYVDMSRYKTS